MLSNILKTNIALVINFSERLLLHDRYNFFDGMPDKGRTIIPCELINYNADTVKEFILNYVTD